MPTSYVPILRGMPAESEAIQHLQPRVKEAMLPLIDLPRLAFDPYGQASVKPPELHFGPALQGISDAWGAAQWVIVDAHGTPLSCQVADGRTYLEWIFDRCRDLGVCVFPVFGFVRVVFLWLFVRVFLLLDR